MISHLPAGSYHLEVISIDYNFPPLRIDVNPKFDGSVRAFSFSTEDAASAPQRVKYPLLLRPTDSPVYFTKPQAFDPFSLLKNPMVIMMLVFGVMMFVMQYDSCNSRSTAAGSTRAANCSRCQNKQTQSWRKQVVTCQEHLLSYNSLLT